MYYIYNVNFINQFFSLTFPVFCGVVSRRSLRNSNETLPFRLSMAFFVPCDVVYSTFDIGME